MEGWPGIACGTEKRRGDSEHLDSQMDNVATWRPPAHLGHIANMFKLAGQLCCVKLADIEQGQLAPKRLVWRVPLWAHFLRVLILAVFSKTLVYLYYQYKLDIKLLQLGRQIELSLDKMQFKPEELEAAAAESSAPNQSVTLEPFELQLKQLVRLLTGQACSDLRDCGRITFDSSDWRAASLAGSLERVLAIERKLDWLGAPYRNAHFSGQVIYSLICLLILMLYCSNQIYMNRVQPPAMSIIRLLSNKDHFQAELELVMARECNTFLQSQQNFLESALVGQVDIATAASASAETRAHPMLTLQQFGHTCKRTSILDGLAYGGGRVGAFGSNGGEMAQVDKMAIMRERHLLVDQVQRMIDTGELQPENRKRFWIELLLLVASFILTAGYTISIALAFLFYFAMAILLDGRLESNAMDILAMGELNLLVVFVVVPGIFYQSIVFLDGVDQVYAVLHLGRDFERCLVINRANFIHMKQLVGRRNSATEREFERAPPPLGESAVRAADSLNDRMGLAKEEKWLDAMKLDCQIDLLGAQMNYNLTRSILKYRLFRAQLKQIIQSQEYFIIQLILIIFLCPLINLLHTPYGQGKFTWFFLLCCCTGTIFCDCCLAPICHLNARCAKLYKPLSSLMAHVIEVMHYEEAENRSLAACLMLKRKFDSQAGRMHLLTCKRCCRHLDARCRRQEHLQPPMADFGRELKVYDQHLFLALYRELQYPTEMLKQFALRRGGSGNGILFTYTTLLKVHFWFILIVLPLIIGINPKADVQQSLFGNLLSDPLGAFSAES